MRAVFDQPRTDCGPDYSQFELGLSLKTRLQALAYAHSANVLGGIS
jgi:hypothetical protein